MKHLVKVETYKFSNGSIYIKILKKENKQKKKGYSSTTGSWMSNYSSVVVSL